jgi:PAS domain S-box-containing protein
VERVLRVLFVEDRSGDAKLAERELVRSGLTCHALRVKTRPEFVDAFEDFKPDLIVCDYALSAFSATEAMDIAKQRAPWVPFLVLTDNLDDKQAMALLTAGADDFVLKEHLTRLGPAARVAIERRRARRKSEAALQGQRLAHVGTWRFTPATGEVEWSDEMRRIFGMGEAGGAPSLEESRRLVHPGDRVHFDELLRGELSPGGLQDVEFRVVRPDGTVRHVVARGTAEEDPGDGRVTVFGTAQDITERRKGQNLLAALYGISEAAQSTRTLGDLFASLHTIIGSLLPAPNFLFALLDPTSGLIEFPYFVDDTGAAPQPIQPGSGLTGRVLRTGEALLVLGDELREMERRGEAVRSGGRSVSWLGVPLKVGGSVIGAMVLQSYSKAVIYSEEDKDLLNYISMQTAQAIERKRSEERLTQLRERLELATRAGHLGVWDWQVGKNAIAWDERMCELYGVENGEFPGTYNAWMESIHPEDVSGVDERVRQALRGERPFDSDFRIVRPDGTVRHLKAYAQVVQAGDGTPIRMTGITYDITERKKLEEQLRQSQKMEAVGNLAGGVAHDFNNLLQAMLSVVQSLRVGEAHPDVLAVQLGALEDHIRRGAQLTRQLLIFSRREIAAPETLDLNATIEAASQMLRRLLRENIDLHLDLSRKPTFIRADRGQVEQVLLNLALNSADAMPAGGRLVIRTRLEGKKVWIEAKDTGNGIPEEIRDRIFDPFFTTKPPGRGTGLGLSVVHGIVTSHGGTIEFESEVGKGTTFRIALPAAGGDREAETATRADKSSTVPLGKGEKVLVVEDEDGAREGLREILTVLGYEAVVVASAEEAASHDAAQGFDVLLADMVLPGMSGIELAGSLRERWPAVKVILMSGYTDEDLVRQGVRAGDLRFLQKPFDMGTLARVVRTVLDSESGAGTA